MNNTLILDDSARPTPAPTGSNLYQRLVLAALEKMTAGSLRLELPDRSVRVLGTPGGAVEATLRVVRPEFFRRCVLFGDVGFGESYVEGEWETDSIERVISWAILNLENAPNLSGSRARNIGLNLLKFYNRAIHLFRPNSPAQARRNIAEHYDLGNDFYQLWLDPGMTYSAALFSSADQALADAQTAKYEALCRKLHLRTGDRVLEIGGGWGGFASHAVRHHGCHVTTVTISRAQYNYARARFAQEGLGDRIDLRLQDFRQITGRFDKIVSIEMMEALGDRYLEAFCAKLDEVLAPDGLAGLQFITVPDTRHEDLRRGVDWIQKHVFPGSILLSVGRVNATLNRTSNLFLHDLEDLGASYARTLHLWWENFNRQQEAVRKLGFDDRFARKWNYYLQYCEAAFARRNISVVQVVYTRPNNSRLAAAW